MGLSLYRRQFRTAEKRVIAFLCQAVQCTDIFLGKDLLRRAHAQGTVFFHTDHGVRDPLSQIQLMQGHHHSQPLLPHQVFQNIQQLQLVVDVQKGGGLIQQDHIRLLAQRPGQQHPLALAVADLGEGQLRQFPGVHLGQGVFNNGPILRPQQAQPSGVGVAAGADNVPAGHQLRVNPLRGDNGQPLRQFFFRHLPQSLLIQVYRPRHGRQLAGQGFQNGGFSGAVRADQCHDLPTPDMQADVFDQGLAPIAHRQAGRIQIRLHPYTP